MRTQVETDVANAFEVFARSFGGSQVERFAAFPVWTQRQSISRFLALAEIYREVLQIHGSIVEVGVARGAALFSWAHFASIYEPSNHTRRVIGFDLWEDETVQQELKHLAWLHDHNRPVGHIPRIELVRGDAASTIPSYVQSNPHVLPALLFIDCDHYAPTETALRCFLPSMSPGAIVAFGGLQQFPEETMAYLAHKDRLTGLVRSPIQSTISYARVK